MISWKLGAVTGNLSNFEQTLPMLLIRTLFHQLHCQDWLSSLQVCCASRSTHLYKVWSRFDWPKVTQQVESSQRTELQKFKKNFERKFHFVWRVRSFAIVSVSLGRNSHHFTPMETYFCPLHDVEFRHILHKFCALYISIYVMYWLALILVTLPCISPEVFQNRNRFLMKHFRQRFCH